MARTRSKKDNAEELSERIVEGIQQRKGKNIVRLDFFGLHNAFCRFFIICHGNSRTQVEAIADSVDEQVKKSLGMDPWHSEGYENAEWILLDYVDVVVHVFQEKTRKFYRLEELWADALTKEFTSED
ncbi:MAG: ribosome silencing factor [Bacteroidales bacterium]|nr:ribosome silencing factor [Lentimicrobiaceae bacterium]MDD5695755.1 ribosome silencing factor [Bacteroidales bacterium]